MYWIYRCWFEKWFTLGLSRFLLEESCRIYLDHIGYYNKILLRAIKIKAQTKCIQFILMR